MPPEVIPNNVPIVNPPTLDFFPFIDKASHWLVEVFPDVVIFIKNTTGILVGISIPLSVLLIIGIVYSVERLKQLRKQEEQLYGGKKVEPAYGIIENIDEPTKGTILPSADTALAERWQTISQHINSENPNDWKQAIIDADAILDDILNKLGYRGESVGEKLKRADSSDFATLKEAWEAHRARNDIAHGGSSFVLNHIEAKRIFQLYRKVFDEFYYI